MKWSFEYGTAHVRDLTVNSERTSGGKARFHSIVVNEEPVSVTKRFWRSFFNRFGVSDTIFRYFEPNEVFQRISEKAGDDRVRYCIERSATSGGRLLAVTNPSRPVIDYHQVSELISRYDGNQDAYQEGIVTSTHRPRSGDRTFEIGGDRFQHRFVMETPVDGFSHPKLYLSFLRLVCSNGAIGYSRAFRSDISMGKDLSHCIARALESYDNGDGYAALRQRFESAQTSWASVRECMELFKLVSNQSTQKNLAKENLLRELYRMTGNLNEVYGLANLDALSVKRQRILPARCRVYDLINFASEVATHHANPGGNRALQAYIGSLISDEFDMEGTAETLEEFGDFFVNDAAAGPNVSLN